MHISDSVLELIGNTPMVRLSRLTGDLTADILVKLEYFNPSGSLKDRIALKMIEDAESKGILKPGSTILESSTGNTGIALSFVGNAKGYKVVIYETTPGKIGKEKTEIMKNYGAEVYSLPPKEDLQEKSVSGAEVEKPGRQKCLDIEKVDHTCWWARQFSNASNRIAHHETAREILDQTKGKVDVFVASIGTGGTLMGIGEVLKAEIPHVRIVGIQPASSSIPMIPGQPYPASEVTGGLVTEMLAKNGLIDEVVRIGDNEAVKMTHDLRRSEGIFAGVSSGANVLVALREARKIKAGNVVTICPDSADRYFTEEHYVT